MSELFTSVGSLRVNLLELIDLFHPNGKKKTESLPFKIYANISIINHNQVQLCRHNTDVISDFDRNTASITINEEFLFENIPSTYFVYISLFGIYNNLKRSNFSGFRKMSTTESSIKVESLGFSKIPVCRLEENQMVKINHLISLTNKISVGITVVSTI